LPQLNLCKDFNTFLNQTETIPTKIAATDSECLALSSLEIATDEILFAVGPEGGFSEKEIGLMKENNFIDVALGQSRLRAETAAIAGIALLKL